MYIMSRKKTDLKNVAYDDVKNLFYVTLYYGTDDNNKPIKKTSTCKTKAEAKKIITNFESDKIKDKIVKPKSETLEGWLEYWMENMVKLNNESTTYCGYKAIINHINPQIGKTPLQKVTPKIIQEYFTHELTTNQEGKEFPLSSNTIKKHYVLLRTALGFAEQQDMITSNPMLKVNPPKYTRPRIAFYDIENLRRLFTLVDGHLLEPAVYLAGMLGLRREEISGLRWINVDMGTDIILINEVSVIADTDVINKLPKTATSIRKLSIPQVLHDILQKVKEQQAITNAFLGKEELENKYVVANWNGEQINPAHLSSMFAKFITKNNLPSISLRGLRHSVASIANKSGSTLYDISKMLGHSNTTTTGGIYVEEFDKTNSTAINSVADAINKM